MFIKPGQQKYVVHYAQDVSVTKFFKVDFCLSKGVEELLFLQSSRSFCKKGLVQTH